MTEGLAVLGDAYLRSVEAVIPLGYIGAVRGEFSGLDHGHARWSGRVQRLLRPQTPIQGLFLTGQDVTKQSLYYAMVRAGASELKTASGSARGWWRGGGGAERSE